MLYPSEIILEVTNRCNVRCRFCHFHGESAVRKRPLGVMPDSVWKRVLEDVESWIGETEQVVLCFHGAGEPLLHPKLKEILSRARGIRGASIGFMTNGMLLDRSWARFLVDLPVDWVWFSIDGNSPLINDRYRKGSRLEKIVRNVEGLIEEKERLGSGLPVLNFNMVAYPDVGEKEIDSYLKKWVPYAGCVSISRFRPIPSKKLLSEEERRRVSYKPCPLLYRQMVISWDGKVGLCCEDINMEVVLGDVTEEGLLEIFNGKRACQVRTLHERGERERVPLCRECDVWASDEVLSEGEREISGVKVKVLEKPSGVVYIRL